MPSVTKTLAELQAGIGISIRVNPKPKTSSLFVLTTMNNSLQLWDGNLSFITRPVPHASSPNEVIVKVSYSGVCETDTRILAGELPVGHCVVLGHEFAGVVSEVGAEVKNVSIGDRVVINPHINCNLCPPCTKGQPQFCEREKDQSIGIWSNGGWSQYTRVPASNTYVLPPQISLRHAILCEPISCILRGFSLLQPLPTNSKILVCGSRVIGPLWLSILHFHGYRKVSLSEISEYRRNLVTGLDIGFKVMHPDTIESEAYDGQRLDKTWGYDVVIHCTSSTSDIQKVLKWMTNGGKLLLFGCYPQNSEIKLNPYDIYNKELKIYCCRSNTFTFPQAIQLVRDMADLYFDFDKLGIHFFHLTNYESGLAALEKERVQKVVFET